MPQMLAQYMSLYMSLYMPLYMSRYVPIYMYGRFNLLVSLLGKLRAEPGLTLNAISVSINAANAAAVTPDR